MDVNHQRSIKINIPGIEWNYTKKLDTWLLWTLMLANLDHGSNTPCREAGQRRWRGTTRSTRRAR